MEKEEAWEKVGWIENVIWRGGKRG